MRHHLPLAALLALWLADPYIVQVIPHIRCIMGSRDQWGFPPVLRPHWQSPCTALTAGNLPAVRAVQKTVNESNTVRTELVEFCDLERHDTHEMNGNLAHGKRALIKVLIYHQCLPNFYIFHNFDVPFFRKLAAGRCHRGCHYLHEKRWKTVLRNGNIFRIVGQLCLGKMDPQRASNAVISTSGVVFGLYWPVCRTYLIATRFWVVVICPIIKCLTVLEFSFILFDLCLFITIFNFILNYVPIVTFWIFTYHKIWILLIIFCFIWNYWIIYFLTYVWKCFGVLWVNWCQFAVALANKVKIGLAF